MFVDTSSCNRNMFFLYHQLLSTGSWIIPSFDVSKAFPGFHISPTLYHRFTKWTVPSSIPTWIQAARNHRECEYQKSIWTLEPVDTMTLHVIWWCWGRRWNRVPTYRTQPPRSRTPCWHGCRRSEPPRHKYGTACTTTYDPVIATGESRAQALHTPVLDLSNYCRWFYDCYCRTLPQDYFTNLTLAIWYHLASRLGIISHRINDVARHALNLPGCIVQGE